MYCEWCTSDQAAEELGHLAISALGLLDRDQLNEMMTNKQNYFNVKYSDSPAANLQHGKMAISFSLSVL